MKFNINNRHLGYIWPKSAVLNEIEDACTHVDILITPNWSDAVSSKCLQITKPYLKYQGAVAIIRTDKSVYVKTARQVTGERLWNTWWLRKRPDKS